MQAAVAAAPASLRALYLSRGEITRLLVTARRLEVVSPSLCVGDQPLAGAVVGVVRPAPGGGGGGGEVALARIARVETVVFDNEGARPRRMSRRPSAGTTHLQPPPFFPHTTLHMPCHPALPLLPHCSHKKQQKQGFVDADKTRVAVFGRAFARALPLVQHPLRSLCGRAAADIAESEWRALAAAGARGSSSNSDGGGSSGSGGSDGGGSGDGAPPSLGSRRDCALVAFRLAQLHALAAPLEALVAPRQEAAAEEAARLLEAVCALRCRPPEPTALLELLCAFEGCRIDGGGGGGGGDCDDRSGDGTETGTELPAAAVGRAAGAEKAGATAAGADAHVDPGGNAHTGSGEVIDDAQCHIVDDHPFARRRALADAVPCLRAGLPGDVPPGRQRDELVELLLALAAFLAAANTGATPADRFAPGHRIFVGKRLRVAAAPSLLFALLPPQARAYLQQRLPPQQPAGGAGSGGGAANGAAAVEAFVAEECSALELSAPQAPRGERRVVTLPGAATHRALVRHALFRAEVAAYRPELLRRLDDAGGELAGGRAFDVPSPTLQLYRCLYFGPAMFLASNFVDGDVVVTVGADKSVQLVRRERLLRQRRGVRDEMRLHPYNLAPLNAFGVAVRDSRAAAGGGGWRDGGGGGGGGGGGRGRSPSPSWRQRGRSPPRRERERERSRRGSSPSDDSRRTAKRHKATAP